MQYSLVQYYNTPMQCNLAQYYNTVIILTKLFSCINHQKEPHKEGNNTDKAAFDHGIYHRLKYRKT